MNEWKEFLIEDLAEFCNAKRVPLSSMQRQQLQGSYPYYGASGIVDYVNDYIFEGSHVLISEDGENLKSRNTPIAFEASGKFWVNNHAHILKAKEQHLTKILIHYFAQLDLSPYLTGAVQPKLNKATLSKIPLYLPSSIAEQKAIASVLSSLDDKIDLLHRQNKTLEAMAETLFRQWFIEEAKEDWVQGKVEDIFVLQRGYDLPSSKRIKGDYPLYAASGLNDNINAYQVEYPTVITGRSGSIGGVYISLEKSWPLNTTLFIKEFKLGTLIFSYFYLKYLDLESFNSGSAVPSLNRNHVHGLEIQLPPEKLVNEYEEIAQDWMLKVKANKHQIQTLEQLRDTLLPKLMSGEVRVQYQTEEVA